jgi:hypothetical protein
MAHEERITARNVGHHSRGFSRRVVCGIIPNLDPGEVFPGRTQATPCDGAAMNGSSKDSRQRGDSEVSTKENLFAEGIATALAVAVLATVAFLLFRG